MMQKEGSKIWKTISTKVTTRLMTRNNTVQDDTQVFQRYTKGLEPKTLNKLRDNSVRQPTILRNQELNNVTTFYNLVQWRAPRYGAAGWPKDLSRVVYSQ